MSHVVALFVHCVFDAVLLATATMDDVHFLVSCILSGDNLKMGTTMLL